MRTFFFNVRIPANGDGQFPLEGILIPNLHSGASVTQSVMYVSLQVNIFNESILLIVQYKYSKSCSGDFYCPESYPPHSIMRYWFYTQSGWVFHFHQTTLVWWK